MSVFKNAANAIVPIREQRRTVATIGALNAVAQLDLNGDESCMIDLRAAAAVTATYSFQGTIDGTNWFPILALPYYALTGTLPVCSQPLLLEAFAAVIPTRIYAVATGGLKSIRVIATAWTSGVATVTINSGPEYSIHPNMYVRPTTLLITATGAVSAAVTATIPAVTGLRHYLDFIDVIVTCDVAIAAATATPLIITTTNLPGTPAITVGRPIMAVGDQRTYRFDPGSNGFAALLAGTATTVVCPVFTSVIWRINVGYRLGL